MLVRRSSLLVLAPALVSAFLSAAPAAQTDYSLAFEPGGKLWTVEVRMAGRGEESLDFWIPLWTAGAYHVAEYGRFVTELSAADDQGATLAVERADKSHFVVRGAAKAKEIVLRYQAKPISTGLFTNDIIDVESNRIAGGYAYVNPVSLFGFVPARVDEATRLTVALPEGWKAATAMPKDEQGRYLAPSYFRFEDSPLLFSPTLEVASFEVEGKPHRVSVHGRSAEDTARIAAGCKRVVEAGAALMQGLPYDHYDFLYGFADEAGGSGLEHSYSTLILVNTKMPITDDSASFWGITAHEFFHLWCAERIHVAGIHRPDYTRPFETGTIWVNEGITEYFTRHILLHAGFYEPEELLATYVGRSVPAQPGQSWTEVSRMASEWDGMQDLMTFAVRMYMVGPQTIFALDMTMRRATDGERGILDLLRHLNADYVKQDRGFAEDELDDILQAVAGAPAVDFYGRFIDGPEIPDPASFLEVIGYRLEQGDVVEVADPSEAQLAARQDYFSIKGQP